MVIPVRDEGLGNTSYLVDLGDGRALAVDASRDLRALKATAVRRGLRIAFAADTHLHADFLSGAVQLAADDGARVLASAPGRRAFDHRGLRDGDEVDLGGLTMRAWATPGHTGEHLAFLLLDGNAIQGVFTGGSLIVGGAARTDLISPERTEPLARAQYHSLRRLAELPDATAVWPTHGAGSFCSAVPGADHLSTIGAEKTANPLLRVADEDAFVKQLLGGLGSFPPYFLRLAELNRRGPALVGDPAPSQVPFSEGMLVIDVRPIEDFAQAHIPGAISIPLRDQFATWLGWVIEPDTPFALVRNPDQDPDEIVWQARKIGHDGLLGELEPWDGPTESIPLVEPDQVRGRVLDVRQDSEFTAGHVPGAVHVELGELARRTLSDEPTVVMCGHGERAMTGASLLARAGHRQVSVLDGGLQDFS
ncbi:MBL fold metallo-hydrolase [Nonomuraea sediminis]|uniref:MBL fold metallo-hydrolase n=1 Tax=Nonomuraea sediminis TaxID=2835864 RepID=UPI001BDC1D5D|nr:MBL fold metallo-hydrolase [Nonomuraea sediminis]